MSWKLYEAMLEARAEEAAEQSAEDVTPNKEERSSSVPPRTSPPSPQQRHLEP